MVTRLVRSPQIDLVTCEYRKWRFSLLNQISTISNYDFKIMPPLDTLIDDALKLVCAVSKDNLLALGFELPTIMEEVRGKILRPNNG